MKKKDDENRDEIAGQLTGKDAGWLGSAWAAEPERPTYMPPLPPPGADTGMPQLGGLSLEAYGEGGSIDPLRKIDKSNIGLRFRFGKPF